MRCFVVAEFLLTIASRGSSTIAEPLVTSYLNDNAQTPLVQFVVYMLYKPVCNKHGEKSNRWSLSLSVCNISIDHRSCDSHRPGHGWSQSPSAVEIFFKLHSCAYQKWVTWAKPRPFWGDLSSLWPDLTLCRKFESSRFSHSWDMDGSPKI